jgi:hypothetical protein
MPSRSGVMSPTSARTVQGHELVEIRRTKLVHTDGHPIQLAEAAIDLAHALVELFLHLLYWGHRPERGPPAVQT